MKYKKRSVEERFWKYVEKNPNGCWLWVGCKTRWGYGRFSVDFKVWNTSRFSFQLHNGPIPRGMFVCHTCDTPSCVNPMHLWLGTPNDNVQDMVKKGRQGTGGKVLRSLTPEQVRQIFALDFSKTYSQAELGRMFGVSKSVINYIINKRTYLDILV